MALSADAVISAASGLGGVLVGSGLLVVAVKAKFAKVDELSRDLDALKQERVSGLERRMTAFEAGCQARHDRLTEALGRVEHMAADLGNLVGWTKKLDTKLDLLGQDAAGARATAEAQKVWLANLDRAHNDHVRDREMHHGG